MVKDLNESNAEKESDDYLIELMGLKNDFPEEAMNAYGEIYKRYWDRMLIIAEDVTKDKDDAMDLLADTFNVIYKRAASFNRGKIKKKENLRLAIINWMASIMRNVFYDHYLDDIYKNKNEDINLEDTYRIETIALAKHIDFYQEDVIEEIEKHEAMDKLFQSQNGHNEEELESENVKKVDQHLSTLSDRDRDIILTTYNYYIPGKNTPTEVLNNLEQRCGTTRENIRKILQKFRTSIKGHLESQLFIRK